METSEVAKPWTQRRRLLATLNGETPGRRAFVTRLETWYKSHVRSGTLPERFAGMSLPEVHRAVGVGQLKFMVPYALRLKNVEVLAEREGEPFYHEYEPEIENFPGMWDYVSSEKPGETVSELRTPAGSLFLRHAMLAEGVFNGTEPYLKEHLIKNEDDLRVVEYILDRCEFVPRFEPLAAEQERLGQNAFVVPLLHRIPFQQILLEYLGEIQLFYWLHDRPGAVQRLYDRLDEQMIEIITQLAEFDWPYVEFPDNITGLMTNPRLFRQFCLPAFQKYNASLHAQGRKVGSHTDGNLGPLLKLLVESDLDVCESVSPYPLTSTRFDEIWQAWQPGPLIWGGIPSPMLEATTTEDDFCAWVERFFETVGDGRILLGVVDLFMRHNSIERVEYITKRIESSEFGVRS